ncbi:uncharacterized protein LOC127291512 [Leptopilina boulardi]|uniref:uncharacterized protein LOC127291512 n=1 Tax=Leptopilina boulardi TaxID=63433 RepID=UPI0021F58089|nr:uncharacterized protein LOC127291512 [Leptopilina boulardi]
MLKKFVLGFQRIYGKQFVSHNVHNLLHICEDVEEYGALDEFSAFKFENEMSSKKRMIRKGHKPLEQIARRYSERQSIKKLKNETPYSFFKTHNSGPITKNCTNIKKQYKALKHEDFTIDCSTPKDSCILLRDGTFGKVTNIVISNTNDILLIVKPFTKTSSVYDTPDSRDINIHMATDSRRSEFSTPITNFHSKVWRIPTNEDLILLPLRHTPLLK